MKPVLAKNAADDLSAFFDVSLDMLCIRDMHGCFVKASPSWERSLGWSMAELVGTPRLSLIPRPPRCPWRRPPPRVLWPGDGPAVPP